MLHVITVVYICITVCIMKIALQEKKINLRKKGV